MNIVKKIVLFLMLVPLMPFWAQAQQTYVNHFSPVFAGTNPMTATISVFIDGMQQERSDLELGSFTGDICRSSSFFELPLPVFPQHYISMPVIHGNSGDIVSFRLYDHSAGEELDLNCITTLVFSEGDNLGNADAPINVYFETPDRPNCYLLVTDADMLVAGRKFMVGTACEGSGKLMGYQNEDDLVRGAVDAEFANHRTEQYVAFNPSIEDMPYQFTMNANGDAWIFFDEANNSNLSVTKTGSLKLGGTPADWHVEIDPSGGAKITTIVKNTMFYLCYDEDFYCSQTEDTLYLFAKCQLINGSVSELNVADPAQMYLVESGQTLEVGNLSTVNPYNLVLEDGAQLITSSSDVEVAVQKNILAYADADERFDWYTLASPVVGEIATSSNMTSNDFDLFYFLETVVTKEWRNYKDLDNGFVNFESGRGYLYANSNDITLNFKGVLNSAAATYAMTYTATRPDDLKGFALVGNPFAHNIKKGSGCAIDDARLASGYYTLTHSGEWEAHTDDETVTSCQGILIQTSEAGDLTIGNVVASASASKSAGKGHLALEVEGAQGRDKAFVYFGEGIGLNKMAHFNDAPMLYLRQNAKDYAIAHYAADETVGEVPVFFQASENGKYAISIANAGLGFDYLHLVDNLTGADLDLTDAQHQTYTFTAHSDDYAARFKLVYQMHQDEEDTAVSFCYFADGRLVIPSIEGEAMLQIVDMSGRIVSSQMVKDSYNQPLNLNAGVYVVRMGDKTQKIVVSSSTF